MVRCDDFWKAGDVGWCDKKADATSCGGDCNQCEFKTGQAHETLTDKIQNAVRMFGTGDEPETAIYA